MENCPWHCPWHGLVQVVAVAYLIWIRSLRFRVSAAKITRSRIRPNRARLQSLGTLGYVICITIPKFSYSTATTNSVNQKSIVYWNRAFHFFHSSILALAVFRRSAHIVLKLIKSTVAKMSVTGRSSKLDSHTPALSHAPPPPADLGFAPNFRPKRCVRCGVWSTQASPYNQEQSPERSWGQLVAWEAGSLLNPLGRHCLLCRKAGARAESDKVLVGVRISGSSIENRPDQ